MTINELIIKKENELTVELNPLTNKIVQCRDYKNRHSGNKSTEKFLNEWIDKVVNVELRKMY